MVAQAYDDDETNEPVSFEQDPESEDFGDGYFTYADGSRRYGSDPDAAQTLDNQNKATRVSYAGDPSSPYKDAIAANEGATGSAAGGTDAPAPSPVSPTPPAPVKPGVIDLDAEEATPRSIPNATGTPPAAAIPNAKPGEKPVVATGTGAAAPGATPPIPPPPLSVSGKKEGTTAREEKSSSASQSTARQGSAEPVEQFNEQQRQLSSAYDKAAADAGGGANDEATLIAKHAAALRADALARESATAAAIQQRDARAAEVTKKIGEVSSRKIDNEKIWKDKGVFGTTMAFLGVLAGSIESTKFKTPNEALQMIQEQKKQNIQSQMEDRNSELRGLERELGSLDAAVPVFEARMNQAIAQKLEANLSDERSQVARNNGQKLVDQLNLERTQKLSEGAKAYYGTIARNQAMQGSSSSSLGSESSTDQSTKPSADAIKAYIDYQADLTKQGYTPDQQAPILRARFGSLVDLVGTPKGEPEGNKRTDEQAKAAAVLTASKQLNEAYGNVQDKNGKWVRGSGPKASDETIAAAKTALQQALQATGYKPGAAEDATEVGHEAHPWKSSIIPFYDLWKDSQAPEDLAAKTNALEAPLRERLKTSERVAPQGAASLGFKPKS